MHTYRTTISSFLVAAMSVYACLLLTDAPVLAQQAAAINKSQTANLALEEQTPQPEGKIKRSRSISKRPLIDLLRRVFDLQQKGALDLDSPLEIIIEGDRNSEGLIQNVVVTQKSGDAELRRISEEFIAALNESGALDFLDAAQHVRLEVNSSKTNLDALISYEAPTAQLARNKAHAYKTLLFMGAQVKRGRDEALIIKGLNVSAKDREVIVNFSMARETFCALLSKYLSSH
jgi:hypothetical protein